MNQRSEHLSDAQIEDYGDLTSAAESEAENQVEKHLAECQSCRGRVLQFQRIRMGLLPELAPEGSRLSPSTEQPEAVKSNLLGDPRVKTDPRPDCPTEIDIRDLAAGLLPEAKAAALAQHASVCDRCGPLLQIYTADFSGELDQEELAAQDHLESASPDWQRQMARQMMRAARVGAGAIADAADARTEAVGESAGRSVTPIATSTGLRREHKTSARRQPFLRWAWIPATAAVCALAFGFWYRYLRETPEKVEKLLAQAYTERRNLEMRWPGAEHADLKQTRSGEDTSLINAPEALRQAGSVIASELKQSPSKPDWLLLSARIDLLDWHYRSALSTLDKIDDAKMITSPEFLMTRSLALYQKAEFEHDALSYREVIDLTGKILQIMPDDRVALFNQGLACEKFFMNECAARDYERLLALDPDSRWSAEARGRLQQLEEKKSPEK